jgi:putative oxidoreductase
METTILYAGRILLGGFFINGAFNHFKNLEMMSAYAKSKGTPLPKLSVAFTGLLLLIGGISVLFNIFPVIGFISLILFLVPVSLIMHAPWKVEDPQVRMNETINFMKNFALTGAVMILLAHVLA